MILDDAYQIADAAPGPPTSSRARPLLVLIASSVGHKASGASNVLVLKRHGRKYGIS